MGDRRRANVAVTLLVAALLAAIGAAAVTAAWTSQQSAQLHHGRVQALHAAETAVGDAVANLAHGAGAGSVGDATYEWSVVDDNPVTVHATGTSRYGDQRTVEVTIERTRPFSLALFGGQGLRMVGGNEVRSWLPGHAADTGNAGAGTNQTVELIGNAHTDRAELFGDDAGCDGPGCADEITVTHSQPRELRTDIVDDLRDDCEGDLGSWRASQHTEGGEATLPAGTWCAENVTFDADTHVNDGVNLVVDGDVRVERHTTVNCDGCTDSLDPSVAPDPEALQIYTVGDQFQLGNHARIGAAVYAPSASCEGTPSNAQGLIVGSLTCNDLRNQGAWTVWWPETLGDVEHGEARVTTWRER